MRLLNTGTSLAVLLWSASFARCNHAQQRLASFEALRASTNHSARPACSSNSNYQFERKIERVAVIGAGPSGLERAAALIEQGFEVRLFERAPKPGGQWFYTDTTPVPAPFP